MDETQKQQIEQYAKNLNTNIPEPGDATLDFLVDEVADRIMIYLNADSVNPVLNRVVARIVVGIYNKAQAEMNSTGGAEREIKQISDNGQSVTYGEEAKNYLASATDEDIFSGFEAILKRYRRADCGNTGILSDSDS
ncbi:MAG: hypothetical protein IIY54_10725 [Ruminococcus sp.]|nr:hypothetical protein [Ruminococcus sp.]MBQ1310172.1 hypothetical protein [Ruminococcus sp.]